jgi:thiol-disulfide isomerase/thioredoxin
MKKNILIVACMVFAVFNFTGLAAGTPNLVGRDMPRLDLKNWLSKEKLDTRDLEDRIYIVEFWATWCPSCVQAMPHLNELAEKYRPNEVFFISVSRDRGARQLKTFIDKNKFDNLFVAMDGGIGDKLTVTWIPIAYIVGTDGKILWQGIAATQAFDSTLEKIVKAAPLAFLSDVDLGPYEDLRFQLSGCSGFPRAYKRLRLEMRNSKSENADTAAEIIKAIDAKLSARIEQIRLIQEDDSDTAVFLYRKLIFRFKGAEPISQARAEYEKLKENTKKES